MKKFLSLTLILILALGLTACGPKEYNSPVLSLLDKSVGELPEGSLPAVYFGSFEDQDFYDTQDGLRIGIAIDPAAEDAEKEAPLSAEIKSIILNAETIFPDLELPLTQAKFTKKTGIVFALSADGSDFIGELNGYTYIAPVIETEEGYMINPGDYWWIYKSSAN